MPETPSYKQVIDSLKCIPTANLCFLHNPLKNQQFSIVATEKEVSAILYQLHTNGRREYMTIMYTVTAVEGYPWLGEISHEGRMKIALGALQKQIDEAVQTKLEKVRKGMEQRADKWASV